jgi:hypothetical protein
MTKMTRSDGKAHASQAGRGSLSSLEQLLRALVDDEVRDIPVAGTGITDGTGAVYKASVSERGGVITTRILIDVTGLTSADSDLDVIGVEDTAGPCHLGQITAAINGTILGGTIQCLEAPLSLTDVGIYSAASAVLVYEDLITDEAAEVVIVTPAVQATTDGAIPIAGVPTANHYLYLVNGAADTPDIFTAGKFLLTLYGYDA